MKIPSILISLVLLSAPTMAANVWHDSKVKRIYPQSGGNFIITLKTPSQDCSRSDNYHFISDGQNGVTPEGIKSMLSVVLAAASQDRLISINFDKDSVGCYVQKLHVEF